METPPERPFWIRQSLRREQAPPHDGRMILGLVGDPGDAHQFANFVSKNLQLYKMRNKYGLSTPAAVHFIRKNLAEGLRRGTPAALNTLVAGYDPQTGGQLYSLDMLASCVKVPFAVHGFGGTSAWEYWTSSIAMVLNDETLYSRIGTLIGFVSSFPDLTEAVAYDVMKLCVQEIHQRLFISLPNFQVKLVSKDGIKELPVINCFSFTQ